MKLSGWGRYPWVEVLPEEPRTDTEICAHLACAPSLIARGNGRSYGDAALNESCVLDMRHMSRLVAFDEGSGFMVCEAGVLLSDLVALFVPRGWFVPVTPGTRFVTIGGMVAADVHGKNHHVAGSFGDHVRWLDLMLADGQIMRCSRQENVGLFNATLGGMGLTGVILRVAFALQRIETDLIAQRLLKAASLDEAMDLFESNDAATYSVAWIDCLASGGRLGRSLITLGEHLPRSALPPTREGRPFADVPRQRLAMPVSSPAWVMNRRSVATFNALYYARGRPGEHIVSLASYFYPLDAIGAWNRLYGRNGFVQYQFVLPKAASREGLRAVLDRVAAAGAGSFLAVLKLFGAARYRAGSLSFPREGYTLALDFPVSTGTFKLLEQLDVIVAAFGGRLYLAKDARSGAAMLAGYDQLDTFRVLRERLDPVRRLSSLLSRRLGL